MPRLKFSRLAFFTLALLSGFIFAADDKSTEETYPVRIILEARPDAKFYQIEWLEADDIDSQAEAVPEVSRREKVTKTEIRRDLPLRFKYFRLRSAYRDDLFGPWGDIVEIHRHNIGQNAQKQGKQTAEVAKPANNGVKPGPGAKPVLPQDVFAQVIDKQGKEKWVLRGRAVAAERLDKNDPLFYDIECLSEKDAPENTNGRKKYTGPLPFTRAGQFKMNLYANEDMAQTEPLQTWIFWVYTEVPRTNVKFYAPFLYGKGGFIVGGKTKIELMAQYSPAAVDKIEYRIYKEGTAPGAWVKYDNEIEINSFAKDQYGYFNIEYQTTNVAGSAEPPQLKRMLIDAKGPTIQEIPAATEGGAAQLTFKDENYPIVVRVYQGGKIIEDTYFKFWHARDTVKLPPGGGGGVEIHAIDLLGNETVLKK